MALQAKGLNDFPQQDEKTKMNTAIGKEIAE